MDFEQIKKLMEMGGGKCAIYKEGEPGYVIMDAAAFDQLTSGKQEAPSGAAAVQPPSVGMDDEFRIGDCALDDISIEDLPL